MGGGRYGRDEDAGGARGETGVAMEMNMATAEPGDQKRPGSGI